MSIRGSATVAAERLELYVLEPMRTPKKAQSTLRPPPLRSIVVPARGRSECEIRILEDEDELFLSLRLRFEVYGALGYLKYVSAARLEIDEYDRYAVPFGAFDERGRLVGTLRLVTDRLQVRHARMLERVLAGQRDSGLAALSSRRRRYAMPSIVSEEIGARLAAANRPGRSLHELSRTIVTPDMRGSGVSRALMEFGLAQASMQSHVMLVGGCLPVHVPMYAKYGYAPLPGAGLRHFDSVEQLAVVVVCHTDALPEPTSGRVEQIRLELGQERFARVAGARAR
jgi:predicted GNAT family N-acyltransferase